ncbi:hypothetical protein ACQP1W_25630 [Spirillospora sp. CA-255316]
MTAHRHVVILDDPPHQNARVQALLWPSDDALADDAAYRAWERASARWWTPDRDELDAVLRGLLDDGSGAVRQQLTGLWLNLVSMPNPVRGLVWIRNNPRVPQYLRGLARVAGCLVLLYAQPVSRLVRLAVHDVIHDDGQVSPRLGDPPTPVPEPFAAMLTELAGSGDGLAGALGTSPRAGRARPADR